MRDTVQGLEGGADDYVTKPFRFEELLARVRVRLRGRSGRASPPSSAPATSASTCAPGEPTVGARIVELTAREFALAEMLLPPPRPGALAASSCSSHVWGYDYDPGSNVVDVYVGYLRRKLGQDLIHSVRGMGYRLERDPG